MTEPQKPFNPWLGILLRPRETIRVLGDTSSFSHVIGLVVLVVVLGMVEGLIRNVQIGVPLTLKFVLVYTGTSLLIAIAYFLLLPPFLLWTGKRSGGVASLRQIRATYAWSGIPNILEYVLFIALVTIFGHTVPQGLGFGSSASDFNTRNLTQSILLAIRVGFSLWAFVVQVVTLSEVQGFAVGKAIFTLVLSTVILLLPLFLLSELNKWIFQML
jgi:Yip1 domain